MLCCRSCNEPCYNMPFRCAQLPQWCPLSVVKGGQAANLLIRSMDSPWGLKMFGNTLVRNIATVIYQVSGTCRALPRLTVYMCSARCVMQQPIMCCADWPCGIDVQDRATLERQIRKNIPPLANTTEFQFGFKIRFRLGCRCGWSDERTV